MPRVPAAAASGDAEGALPLLQHSGRQLQVVVQELGAAAAALPSQAELDQLQARLGGDMGVGLRCTGQ